jgi:8-oxo-dGTP pyrophosphatase MutT (NUDIX family)
MSQDAEEVLTRNDDVVDAIRSKTTATMSTTAAAPSIAPGTTCTLASDYWIECNIIKQDDDESATTSQDTFHYEWSLVPLLRLVQDLDSAFQQSAGATAWAALHSYSNKNINERDDDARTTKTTSTITAARAASALFALQSRVSRHNDNTIHLTLTVVQQNNNQVTAADDEKGENEMLIAVLARVLAQWTLALEESKSKAVLVTQERAIVVINWPDDTTTTLPAKNNENECQDETERIRLLYQGVFDVTTTSQSSMEIVEMVDRQGLVLGRVPRKLVHQFNILHRGIGMFVTRDRPILFIPSSSTTTGHHQQQLYHQQQQPDLYVHQRTATKRIFPSLYDMFVGGVALAGESSQLTARREVAEELGLEKALLLLLPDENNDRLSDCIFTCTVCTAYNRCVVDFFTYTMDTTTEHVSWQEEEVAWGDFVPYHIVESAADLSIQRLANRNEWPGRYPPIQSHSATSQQEVVREGSVIPTSTTTTKLDNEEWKTWHFVPDGLLVWEAWLHFLDSTKQ